MNITKKKRDGLFGKSAIELVLVIVVCMLLWYSARGLADSTTVDLRPDVWWQSMPTTLAERVDWLNVHIGPACLLLGMTGWVALVIGRLDMPLFIRLLSIASLWLLAGTALAIGVGRITVAPFSAALSAYCLGISGLLWIAINAWRQVRLRGDGNQNPPIRPLSVWIYPGWLLFGGLGTLWLLDYAARGYDKYRYLGVYQFDNWFLATFLFTLIAAATYELLVWMSRRIGRLEDSVDLAIAVIPVLVGAFIAVVAVIALVAPLSSRPVALLTEVLRLPAWLGMAWLTYRWVGTGLRPVQGTIAAAGLLLCLLLALWVLKDRGPILVQAIAIAVVVGCLVSMPLRQRSMPKIATLSASAVTIAALMGIAWGVYRFAPEQRVAAIADPYSGELEYLSEIHWFLRATPTAGFGLGNVPWCGNAGSLHIAGCSGVPRQIQSDYVFVALSGVWGALPATLLIVLLLIWLVLLIDVRFAQASPRAVDLNTLAGWLVAAGGITYAVQTIVSSLGSLGAMPITGISIPFLAYGGSSLFTLALLAGLASNHFPSQNRGAS